MNWDHIRIFLTVARCGQMLEAGRRLGLNHSTVARRIEALEASVGHPLFHRRPNGSVLSDVGEQLVPVAERIEAEVVAMTAQLQARDAEPSGTVRIGVPDGLGSLFLAQELGGFARRHAGLTIELVPLPRSFSLSRREADLAIGLDRPSHGRLILSKLTDYTLGLYAAPSYLDDSGIPTREEDLATHAAVTGIEDYAYASALDYSSYLEERVGRVLRCAGAVAQLEAVRAGAGIGVLHDFAASGSTDLVQVLPEIVFKRSYWLMSHPESHEATRIAACRRFIVECVREKRQSFMPR